MAPGAPGAVGRNLCSSAPSMGRAAGAGTATRPGGRGGLGGGTLKVVSDGGRAARASLVRETRV